MILSKYQNLREVFSKDKSSRLLPYHPCDSAIELLPGIMTSHGQIYPLSVSEQQAMEEKVQQALWILNCSTVVPSTWHGTLPHTQSTMICPSSFWN